MKASKLILTLSVIIVLTSLILLVITLDKYGITGFATDNATANLTISAGLSVSFIDDTCEFGAGYVDENPEVPFDYAYVYTNGTSTINGTWTSPGNGLNYTNDGNVPISVSIDSTKNATTFIGGTSPGFEIQSVSVGCDGTDTLASFASVTGSGQAACTNMSMGGYSKINFALKIPENALPGTSTAVITATASVAV